MVQLSYCGLQRIIAFLAEKMGLVPEESPENVFVERIRGLTRCDTRKL